MKFGITIRDHVQNCEDCDASDYVDYHRLKKLIKSNCTEDEFQQEFHHELHKVVSAMRDGKVLEVDPEYASINKTALDKITKKYDKKRRSELRELNKKVTKLTFQSALSSLPYEVAAHGKEDPNDAESKTKIQLSPTMITFIAGGTSGIVSRCCTAPLDRIKILMQADSGKFGAKRRGIVDSFQFVLKDGGIRGFWQGNFANVLKVVPESATKFMVYDLVKGELCRDEDNPRIHERLAAGCVAGGVSQTMVYPLDIVKTRLAASSKGDYKGIIHCFKHSIDKGGFRSLFRGLGPALAAIIPAAGIDLAVYNTLRDKHAEWAVLQYSKKLESVTRRALDPATSSFVNESDFDVPPPAVKPPTWLSLCFGAVSATSGALVAYPLTLIRTKLMTQGMRKAKSEYVGVAEVIQGVYETAGFRGFYRGLIPSLLKTVPAISIGYSAFETAKTLGNMM